MMERRNCERCSGGYYYSKLDEIRSTLWSISVIAQRMIREIDEIMGLRASPQAEPERRSAHDWL